MTIPQKPKSRNYVAKNARNMSGAGAHKEKKGQNANRARQKDGWKKEITEAHPMPTGLEQMLKQAFGNDVRVDISPGMEANTHVEVRWPDGSVGNWELNRQTGDSVGLGGRFQIGSPDEKKLSAVEKQIKSAIRNTSDVNESMLRSMNESIRTYNPFEEALMEVEKEFNISLKEGDGEFSEQQFNDMKKLIQQYKAKSANPYRDEVANDLEMLEYTPDEIPGMVNFINQHVKL